MWQLGKILANIVVVKINFTYKRSESMAYISVVQVICILKTSQRYVLDFVCLDERAFSSNKCTIWCNNLLYFYFSCRPEAT